MDAKIRVHTKDTICLCGRKTVAYILTLAFGLIPLLFVLRVGSRKYRGPIGGRNSFWSETDDRGATCSTSV